MDSKSPSLHLWSNKHGLLLPGGERSTNSLRSNKACAEFVREFFKAAKPVAAISLGSQALIDADVVDGRRMTSDPSIKSALIAAGADWVDAGFAQSG